jgi:hypothetical protein
MIRMCNQNPTNTGGPREQPIVESGVVGGGGGPWKTPNEPSRYPWAGACARDDVVRAVCGAEWCEVDRV